jgi:diacylglycerol kinase family enzyme
MAISEDLSPHTSEAAPKVAILINPVAGNREGALVASQLRKAPEIERLGAAVVELNLSDCSSQVQAARSSDLILIGGGDGTVSRVVEGLQGYSGGIGLLPLGTANDLARELGVRTVAADSSVQAVLKLLTLPTQTLDIWSLACLDEEGHRQRHTFMNYCSWGYDAAVLSDVDRWRKANRYKLLQTRPATRLAYLSFGLKRLCERRKVQVTLSGPENRDTRFEVSALLVSNIRSYMGAGTSNYSGAFGDAKLEIIPLPSPLSLAAMVLPGRSRAAAVSASSASLSFAHPPVFCQIDGECLEIGNSRSFEISRAFSIKIKCAPRNK